MKKSPPILTREYFGLIFYFFDDPGQIRQQLLHALMCLLDTPDLTFARVSEDGERYGRFGGDFRKYISSVLLDSDFGRSHFFQLSDGSRTDLHTHLAEFSGRRIREEFRSKTPNYVYVELPIEYDPDLLWHLFVEVFRAESFFLGLGNAVLTGQLESHPRSGAEAAKALRQSAGHQVGFWEIFGNLSYHQQLETRQGILYGPAQFIALGSELAPRIPFEDALNAAGIGEQENEHFSFFPDDCGYFFRADTIECRRRMWHLLHPLEAQIERPWMYWKDDQWNEWYSRVSMKEQFR